jgi:uncharacterized membrane protein YdjX (TVP38/TMEM64 family)
LTDTEKISEKTSNKSDEDSSKIDVDNDKNNTSTGKKAASIVKLCILAVIVVGIPLYVLLFRSDFLDAFNNLDAIRASFENNRVKAVFIYLAAEILQIIVPILPGQVFQITAGYFFGVLAGLLYSVIGAAVGTTITYYLAHVLGHNAVRVFVKKEKLDRYLAMLNSKKAYIITFLIYLIPGMPKDLMCYAAGISEMKFKPFLLLSLCGRMFGMSMSLMIGAFYYKGNYVALIIVAIVATALFIVCIINRKAINAWLDKMYDRISSNS